MKNWSWTLCTLLAFGLVVHLDAYNYYYQASSPKPGDCPDVNITLTTKTCDECSVDSNCIGNEKCCQIGCGRQCVEPTFNNTLDNPGVCPSKKWIGYGKTCNATDECSNDQNCTGNEKCCSKGCGRVCVVPDKPGSCPRFTWRRIWRNCTDECSNDFNCTGSEKCCRHGCKNVCVAPVKPGSCPPFSWKWHKYCHRRSECSNDFHCPGNKKCCRKGCRYVCVSPVKPGSCPRFSWKWHKYCHFRSECSNDFHCPGNKKCCRKGCRYVCVSPRRYCRGYRCKLG